MAADDPRRPNPVDWPTLVERQGPEYEQELGVFADLAEELAEETGSDEAGGALAGFDDTVSALAVLRGPEVTRPVIEQVAPAIPRLLALLAPVPTEGARLGAYYTLNYLNAARCCGASVGGAGVDAERAWLPRLAAYRAKLTERERHTLAIAAAAAGLPDEAAQFAGLGRRKEFSPNVTHAFDVPAFAVYIATAVEAGASYQDVEPAWLDFVHRFPYKLDTGMLKWPSLLWAARAVYAAIGKLDDDEVATELHRLVTGA
jgi:hypothetical protein